MTCERSDCDEDDDVDRYETEGPPEGTFTVELCDDHAPSFATAEASD